MDRNDVVTAVGMVILVIGIYMIYPPAALIVGGVAMMAVGMAGAWSKAKIPLISANQREQQPERGKGTGK